MGSTTSTGVAPTGRSISPSEQERHGQRFADDLERDGAAHRHRQPRGQLAMNDLVRYEVRRRGDQIDGGATASSMALPATLAPEPSVRAGDPASPR